MSRTAASLPSIIFAGLFLALLTACGTKPDGTPYGVDPAKLPAGRRAKAAAARPTPLATGMPKGAELNAVTSGASAGRPQAATGAQPSAAQPQ